ncbi:MAG TPA: MFS transporter, partial [Candidatus Paraprevotella stercorigallinarum]|nr:MFS transporter [Candidatus Paraprevotella stercorigallinarum]
MKQKKGITKLVDTSYMVPFILITSLFFLWGGVRSIMDVLNKHFQMTMGVSHTHAALMQTVIYGAYFLMALPGGQFIRRFGTRSGIVFGLMLFGIGALMFIPTEFISSFYYILLPLFIIGCGLVILEIAANPYVTLLGDPATAAGRLNRAQSFNPNRSLETELALFLMTAIRKM